MSSEFNQSFFTEGLRGLRLHGRFWRVPHAKGSVLIIHGYSEHSGRYLHLADFLAKNNYEVFAIDLPGHGQSEGRRNDVKEGREYIVAIEHLVREAQRLNAKTPIHLFAHSLGALSAIRFLQESPLAGSIQSAVFSGPLLGLHRYPAKALVVLKFLTGILPNLSLSNKDELGVNSLTHDPEMARSREADPLVNSISTLRWVHEFTCARELAFQKVEKLRLPTLFLKAEEEVVVDPHEIDRFFSLVTFPKKEMKVYAGMRHEIVNEVERFKVFQDLLSWFDSLDKLK